MINICSIQLKNVAFDVIWANIRDYGNHFLLVKRLLSTDPFSMHIYFNHIGHYYNRYGHYNAKNIYVLNQRLMTQSNNNYPYIICGKFPGCIMSKSDLNFSFKFRTMWYIFTTRYLKEKINTNQVTMYSAVQLQRSGLLSPKSSQRHPIARP